MTKSIRIVFTDIDGTIFHEGRLMDSAISAIAELHRRGILVSLCTGRSVLHARSVLERLGLEHAVYFNGGLAVAGSAVVHRAPMAADVVVRIREFSETTGIPAIFHSDREAYVLEDIPDVYRPLLESFDFPPLRRMSMAEWHDVVDEVYQANLFLERVWDTRVQNLFPECLLYRWADTAIDLQRRGNDKSVGALAVLRHLGISPAEAVHIGDGGNDIGMFQTLGFSVAMGNAPADVQRFAQRVSRPVDEDGFHHALVLLGLLS